MLKREAVYNLCVRENWFTCGSNSCYERMFSLVDKGYGVEKVAVAIWVCSDNVDLSEITSKLYETIRRD